MVDKEDMSVEPNETILREVTFEHLSDSDKKVLLDAGFEKAAVLINNPDPQARREAEVELAESYLKKPACRASEH